MGYDTHVTTYLCTDDIFLQHRPQGDHPERPDRLVAIRRALAASDLLDRVRALAPRPATREELLRVHTEASVAELERRLGPGAPQAASGWLDPDTYFGPGSYQAALYAAGGASELALRVYHSERDNGFALVRPPGHHACRDRAMGFCLLNNIAVAAAAVRAAGGRVAIVDFDVHHGNGTEQIFLGDPTILFVSTHQYPFYPGTGAAAVTGLPAPTGDGPHDRDATGTTINIPLPQGSAGDEYMLVFDQVVVPALRRFAPDVILVSAGFDGHARDPLAGMSLVEEDYARMVRILLSVQPRVAMILEGGYHPDALAGSVMSTLRVLLGEPETQPTRAPVAPAPRSRLAALPTLEEVRHLAATLQSLHHLR